jgi:hypothetical protein
MQVLAELAGDAWKGMFAQSSSPDRRRSFCAPPS